MENIHHYNHRVSVLFNNYLQEHISLNQLIQELRRIEFQLSPKDNDGLLWFKFSQDDTLASTIDDLQYDLANSRNAEFTKERMRDAINLENELFIYYS